ncbi:hypothetical protein HPB51_019604 [Rhipicephalus microplus]|uniref:HTH psq-type domain-containing protein n=1 Tax=Rhipicephalus microplus TaxID=6941 RepID=A0A9J6DJB8_RHIMP|nr:hypothetical protein HPB51_019604 [Rhipicephalus microplus]
MMVDGGKKRNALDLATKRAISAELAQGPKNCELVKKYGVNKSTILTILKNKEKISSADAHTAERKRLQRATYTDVEDALLKWLVSTRAQNIPVQYYYAKAKDCIPFGLPRLLTRRWLATSF